MQKSFDTPVGGTRLHKATPPFDSTLHWSKRAARHDRSRDDHAAGQLALQCEPGAPTQNRDLCAEAQEFRDSRHHDVEILPGDLRLQRLDRFVAPDLNALRDHPHGIDDLGVARHRFCLKVGAGSKSIRPCKRNGSDLLIQYRDSHKTQAGRQND